MARNTGTSTSEHRLISSDRVDGTTVYNARGEKIGTIDHLMIDKYSGQVDYAVMSFGGFLGMGEGYHPLPWNALEYDTSLDGYRVNVDRTQLETAPRYTANAAPNWSDRTYTDRVDEHWGHRRQRDDIIVAMFESPDRARAARDALMAVGISSDRLQVLEHQGDAESWGAMKEHWVPDEDIHPYAEGLRRGHVALVVRLRPGEHDLVFDKLQTCRPIDIDEHATKWRQAGWSGVHPGNKAWETQRQSSHTTAATQGAQEVIPVYEEQLRVGKRTVEQSGARIRVYTVEQPVQEGVTLRQERVSVERRPVDRPVTQPPADAFRERTIDVTERREEPVVSKEARVKEEIVVRKEADERKQTVRDTVRRTEVEVEDDRRKVAPGTTTTRKP